MNVDQRIEAALRRRPSEERAYAEPLAALVANTGVGVQRLRPVMRSRGRTGGLAAVAMVVVLLAAGVGLAIVGLPNGRAGGPAEVSGGGIALTGLIGCSGSQPGFSPDLIASAFTSGIANAEKADSSAAAALRALLASDQSRALPAANWLLVSESPNEVQYLAGSPYTFSWVYVDVQSGSPAGSAVGTGGWHAASWGICDLYAVPPDGYDTLTWTVDPAQPYVAGSTELHILSTEPACYGANAVGRFEANVAYGTTAVTVTAFGSHGVDPQPCTASPATFAVVLHLDRPLGGLALMDGGPWPAKTRESSGQAASTSTPGIEVTIPPGLEVSPGCSVVPAAPTIQGCGASPIAAPSVVSGAGPTPAATFMTYVVMPGDYMSKIAAKFALQLWELKLANPKVADLDHIVVGQILNIPSPGQLAPPSATPASS
jgi:LysM repeat protein